MSEVVLHHKFILLGASRGLGWGTYLNLCQKYPNAEFLLFARKKPTDPLGFKTEFLSADFSNLENSFLVISEIHKFQPTHIVYFAGGGPFGFYQDKKWSDHQWAFNVTFLTPAKIIHELMVKPSKNLNNFTVIGSKIAEASPDPKAASYCAAKHALNGLISTLQQEPAVAFKLKIFSPGYIKTDLLPEKSWPREQGLALSVGEVASQLLRFIDL